MILAFWRLCWFSLFVLSFIRSLTLPVHGVARCDTDQIQQRDHHGTALLGSCPRSAGMRNLCRYSLDLCSIASRGESHSHKVMPPPHSASCLGDQCSKRWSSTSTSTRSTDHWAPRHSIQARCMGKAHTRLSRRHQDKFCPASFLHAPWTTEGQSVACLQARSGSPTKPIFCFPLSDRFCHQSQVEVAKDSFMRVPAWTSPAIIPIHWIQAKYDSPIFKNSNAFQIIFWDKAIHLQWPIYTNNQTKFIMQNFGSNPKTNCKHTTETVISSGFLYFWITFTIQWLPYFVISAEYSCFVSVVCA